MKSNPTLSDLLPALIATGILLVSSQIANLPFSPAIPLSGLFGAFCVYRVDHAVGTERPDRFHWKTTYIPVGFAIGLLILTLFRYPGIRWMGILIYIGLSIAYVIPVLPGKRRIQDLRILRTLVILVGWSGIPFLLEGFSFTLSHLLFSVALGGYLFPNILLQDKLDQPSDIEADRMTWAGSMPAHFIFPMCMVSLVCSLMLFLWCDTPSLALCPAGFLLVLLAFGQKKTARMADGLLLGPLVIALLKYVSII